ncbi:6-bladed beta-propeller [Aestuariirhabdus litorea]|uniref:6-bladed beta-propeller n=1 Tax=Aestuariirhabdus litorea TaxID=2528527 RepID=A0A3P3VR51_9GAMM|nr:6-bladed beta-propeller [Aestuariirhabdus litorea]RRJ85272.1 6-bladed beta-propeller [Aestuariirhabdus litorea]RWW98493.1 6-bladed beta-propeller [Endozoicomonadaceae bacterium GTF-13]
MLDHTKARLLLVLALTALTGCVGLPQQQKSDFVKPVYPSPPDEARFYWQEMLTSSADVELEEEDKAMERWLTGTNRQATGLGKPFDVSVYQGKAYVSDNARREIVVFDRAGHKFQRIGTEDDAKFRQPFAIDHDLAGNLYVIDGGLKQALIFDAEGNYVKRLGSKEMFDRPSGIAVSPDGSRLFIVDTAGVSSPNHRVRVFNPVSGEHLFDFGTRGTEPGQFNLPKNAAYGSDGLLYVNDSGNFRIQVFNPEDGSFIRSVGSIGRTRGNFARPKGIAIDPAGNLYVADAAFGNFQIFNPDGQLLMFVGGRGAAGGPGQYMLPAGLDVDEDGRVYMVDQFFSKVEVFRPAAVGEDEGYFKVLKERVKREE